MVSGTSARGEFIVLPASHSPGVQPLKLRRRKAKWFTKTAYLSGCGFLSEISLASASSQKITCAGEGGCGDTPSFCPFLFTSIACPVLLPRLPLEGAELPQSLRDPV